MRLTANQALWVTRLSEAALLDGCLEDASILARHALALARARKGRGYEAYALRLLGDIAAHGEPLEVEPAATHYLQALALATASQAPPQWKDSQCQDYRMPAVSGYLLSHGATAHLVLSNTLAP